MSTRNGAKAYCITNVSPAPKEGSCDGHTGVVADLPDPEEPEDPVDPGEPDEPDEPTSPTITYMQTLTNANCPSERTVAVDARDNRTYWVKKFGSNCWMMSDPAYAGGGTNTYGDTVTISNNTGSSYASARYYTLPQSSPTTHPTEPSTATNGLGQLGLLYNWCAVMGGQAIACTSGSSSTVDRTISICPAGWRVPTRPQQQSLLTMLGASENSAGSVIFRRDLRAQYNGYWYLEPLGYGIEGSYWSSAISASTDIYVSDVTPSGAYVGYAFNKQNGLGLRCIIN